MKHLGTLLIPAILAATACQATTTINPPPTGAPRQAKGTLPMTGATKPMAISAVREKDGKPVVATKSTVTAAGGFSLSLEVGVRYTFVVTLVDGATVSLFASDVTSAYYGWIAVGNAVDLTPALEFGTLVVVDGLYVSSTVLLGIDWDGDGIADFSDADDDNDGIPDEDDYDIDGDGVEDDYLDADGDGECDLADTDDDGDGVPDTEDQDDDGDGVPDEEDPDDGF